jgi:hypothetical protein
LRREAGRLGASPESRAKEEPSSPPKRNQRIGQLGVRKGYLDHRPPLDERHAQGLSQSRTVNCGETLRVGAHPDLRSAAGLCPPCGEPLERCPCGISCCIPFGVSEWPCGCSPNMMNECKAGGWSTQVEPTFNEQGLDSTIGSVCRVRQSGMPNEPRRAPPS